jgi:hypothetical protein
MKAGATVAAETHMFTHQFSVWDGNKNCPASYAVELSQSAYIGGMLKML